MRPAILAALILLAGCTAQLRIDVRSNGRWMAECQAHETLVAFGRGNGSLDCGPAVAVTAFTLQGLSSSEKNHLGADGYLDGRLAWSREADGGRLHLLLAEGLPR